MVKGGSEVGVGGGGEILKVGAEMMRGVLRRIGNEALHAKVEGLKS